MNHQQFIYHPDKKMRLADFDPNFTDDDSGDEKESQKRLQEYSLEIAKYQDILMAHEQNGLLVVFQAMDGAGKDAAIKNVMSALDPQGCEMKMFKAQKEVYAVVNPSGARTARKVIRRDAGRVN